MTTESRRHAGRDLRARHRHAGQLRARGRLRASTARLSALQVDAAAPSQAAAIYLPQTISEITGPALGEPLAVAEQDADLTIQHEGEPIGERMIVSGHVYDTEGKPLRNTLVEVWQANACGRYKHVIDNWPAPLDPNFSGAGRCLTDDEGRYRFLTIKPGPVPVGQPLQRLAARPHPLLADGPGVRPAARHPDVLPRRPVLPL